MSVEFVRLKLAARRDPGRIGMTRTCCDEIVGLEVEKYFKPINQDEYSRPEDAPICEVGLEAIVVYVRSNVVPLNLHGTVCEVPKYWNEGEA